MRGLVLALLGWISVQVWGQDGIDYQHKAIEKVLSKDDISGLTEIPVADSIKQRYGIHGKFFEVRSEDSPYHYMYTGRVNSCRTGGCSLSSRLPGEGESEYFDYFILFDQEKTVRLVRVFNYQATHGHGITARGWLKQFAGHDGSVPLQVDKNIDAISGATISVHAIVYDLNLKTKFLQKTEM